MFPGEKSSANALSPRMRDKPRSHMSIAELANRQHGVVSISQLRELGYARGVIADQAKAGRLHRLHRGVYAVGHMCLSDHGRCLAAVLACDPNALLSHASAAWLWGLVGRCGIPVHVSVPRSGHARASLHAHRAPAIREEDRAVCEGIPVTAVPRTLLDFAATASAERLRRALERSEQLDLFDLSAVDSLLARTAGHAGCGRLRRALAVYREPAFTRSELERRFLALVRKAKLPLPSVNFYISGHELDMYWHEERFAVELDGFETHRTRAAFERDRIRQEDLKLAGIEMTRITYRRMTDEPATVAKRLRKLLAERRPPHR